VIGPIHHVGISVEDMDRSISFWSTLLGASERSRRVVDAAFLGVLVGYPGITLEIAWLDLPDGSSIELVRHAGRAEPPLPEGTAHPGTVHLCLTVGDIDDAVRTAIAAGAAIVSASRVEIPSGPNQGARHIYLRGPDGVTIELRQPPPG
jgi:catechol 2,3-dioxygenase-like lactoylglutathione lyase family enzyme